VRRTLDGSAKLAEHAEPADNHPRDAACGNNDLDMAVVRERSAAAWACETATSTIPSGELRSKRAPIAPKRGS
jgi:hypothetical protein